MKKYIFSCILLVFNEEKNIKNLDKLIEITRHYSSEIIIIDSESTDRTSFIIKQKLKKFKNLNYYLINKKNFNFSTARNFAVKHSSGKYILFLSADASILKINFSEIQKIFHSNKKIVAIYGKQIPRKNCNFFYKTEIECRFENLRKYFERIKPYLIQDKDQKEIYQKNNDLHSLYFLSNVFCFYRRDFLLKHKFEKKGSEDLIMGKKIIDLGYKKAYDPRQIVIHSHNFSLLSYIHRQIEEYEIVINNFNIKKKSLLWCKFKKILNYKTNIFDKVFLSSQLIFFYLIKLFILFWLYFYKHIKD